MKIKWYGHSCFEITSDTGVKIITDPFDERVGYKVPSVEADIITVSHSHYDHDNTSIVKSDHVLLNRVGEDNIKGVKVIGIKSYHDDVFGEKRGENVIFKYYLDGMVVCHLGDLGCIPSEDELNKLRDIDILIIPVGGIYTIDSEKAVELIGKTGTKVIIPMHYKTEKLKFELEPVDNFTKYFHNVCYLDDNQLEIYKENIIEQKIYIFSYKN